MSGGVFKVLVNDEEKLSCGDEAIALLAFQRECEQAAVSGLAKSVVELQAHAAAGAWFSRVTVESGKLEVGGEVMVESRDDTDRCCAECGNHFDGTPEDDYCTPCYERLEGGC